MRRIGPLAFALTLAGCSGLGRFEGDTLSLPGANPALPSGASETMMRVEAKGYDAPPLRAESGNVWPGQPKPFPTLEQVEKETQAAGTGTGTGGGSGGAAGGGAGPAASGGGRFEMKSNPNAASTIIIPNGNGTSTEIMPDGAVKVIPTPAGHAPAPSAPAP